jgi:hypothetical protein
MNAKRPLCLHRPSLLAILAFAGAAVLSPVAAAIGADEPPPDAKAPAARPAEKPDTPSADGHKPAPANPGAAENAEPKISATPFSIRIELEPGGKGKVIVSDGKNPPVVHDLRTADGQDGGAIAGPGGIIIRTNKPGAGQAAGTIQMGVAADSAQGPVILRNIRVNVNRDGACTVQQGAGGLSFLLTEPAAAPAGKPEPTIAAPADIEDDLKNLKSPEGRVRILAARALALCGDPRVVAPLIEALKDTEAEVRQLAATGLGRSGDKRAVEPLIARLKDENRAVRREAAEVLGGLADERAVDGLVAALKDADWRVRKAAAESLGQIGDTRAAAALEAATDDCHFGVRRAAVAALRAIKGPLTPPLPEIPQPPQPINSYQAGR